MKTILILGAGTAGTAMAHKARRRLPSDWEVAVVDPSTRHVYQPGLLFLPFGDETEERIVRERSATLGKGITWHQTAVKTIDTERGWALFMNRFPQSQYHEEAMKLWEAAIFADLRNNNSGVWAARAAELWNAKAEDIENSLHRERIERYS